MSGKKSRCDNALIWHLLFVRSSWVCSKDEVGLGVVGPLGSRMCCSVSSNIDVMFALGLTTAGRRTTMRSSTWCLSSKLPKVRQLRDVPAYRADETTGKGTTFYSHLGVEPGATTSEITKAYRKRSLELQSVGESDRRRRGELTPQPGQEPRCQEYS